MTFTLFLWLLFILVVLVALKYVTRFIMYMIILEEESDENIEILRERRKHEKVINEMSENGHDQIRMEMRSLRGNPNITSQELRKLERHRLQELELEKELYLIKMHEQKKDHLS